MLDKLNLIFHENHQVSLSRDKTDDDFGGISNKGLFSILNFTVV